MKTGLDDYLNTHTIEELKALPVIEVKSLDERIAEATIEDIQDLLEQIAMLKSKTERGIYVQKLSERLKVSKREIQRDLKAIGGTSKKDDNEPVISADFKGLIDIVKGRGEEILFLIKEGDSLITTPSWEVDGTLYIPPQKDCLPFELPNAETVIKSYKSDNDLQLFGDVITYLKKFSYLKDKQWLVIANYVFLTYIQDHPDVHYLAMLLFYAVPERGKSRTGKAIIYIAYRGVYLVDLREANLFRFSQNLKATLFFDIMNIWKKAEKNGAEDILLLRHEKGAKATRVIYPEKGAFKDMRHFDIYGATLMATNEPLHKILDSRSIPITMPNKPGNYENPVPEKTQGLKERLTAWRAKIMDKPLPEVALIPELNGRLWDISKPLLQVCKVVCPHVFEGLKDVLLEVAGQRIEDRKVSIEGQIITILDELSPEGIPEWTIKTSEVLNKLNDSRPEAHKLTSQYLGRKLKAMGLPTKIIMGYSEIKLKKTDFDILLIQYGIIDVPVPVETLLNSTNLSNQGISTVYDSRELVESQENSTETLLSQSLDNQASKSLVEKSRELQDAGKKKYLETLEVIGDL